jgi:hypothetical protein
MTVLVVVYKDSITSWFKKERLQTFTMKQDLMYNYVYTLLILYTLPVQTE